MTAQTYFCPKIVFLRFSEPHLVLILAFLNLKTDISPWFVDRMKYSTLVPFFDNRWRWCRGRFSLKQISLEFGYQGSYFGQKFCHSLGFDFFITLCQLKPNIYCIFIEIQNCFQDNCVGGILSSKNI